MKKFFLFTILILGILGLFLEQQPSQRETWGWALTLLDYLLAGVILGEAVAAFIKAPLKRYYFRTHIPSLVFLAVYLGFFTANRIVSALPAGELFKGYFFLVVIRNIALVLKIYGRVRKLKGYLSSIFSKPAQTVVASFILVILVGTLLLMMPPMNSSGHIRPVDALFTVTSAVCVTGLIVVDTAVDFTFWGQLVILVVIQIGGLGIMLLSYFLVFSFRRSVSLKDRKLLSYMLNASDMRSIINSVKRIIILTFAIELGGAAVLFPRFLLGGLPAGKAVFHSIFHAISAFCNAGFALYTDSLVSFRSSPWVNFTIAALIIAGGISFTVITEVSVAVRKLLHRKKAGLSINSQIVLKISGLLTLVSLLVIYKLEYARTLSGLPLGEEYLSAFFQAVTLRTAGFNTLPFEAMGTGTLMFMMGIMFIGGASGSTAGGIKVNSLGVVLAYIHSFRTGGEDVLIRGHLVPREQVLQAFTVIVFGILAVFIASLLLFITEDLPPIPILFEAVSAFATVGLSAGITGALSVPGKLIIVILMFIGRLGPLTLLSASAVSEKASRVSYPDTTILIG
jgi:trk system potassium uptake protein TrkH